MLKTDEPATTVHTKLTAPAIKNLRTEKTSGKNYFAALTGIRIIAAYMVFLHHYNFFTKGSFAWAFVNELHIGLPIFFVLSGFLITYRYYANGSIHVKNYIVNRVARVYPMYFLLTTLTFILAAFTFGSHHLYDLKIYLLNITFLRGFFSNLKFTGIAQGWSLTTEECFYFLAPLFFLFIQRSRWFLVILPLICVAFGLSMVYLSHAFSWGGFFSTISFMFNYTFFGRCGEFFIGIALALFFKKYGSKVQTKWCTYAGAATMVLCAILLMQLKKLGNYEFGIQHPFGLFTNNVLLPLLGIAVLFWGLLTEQTLLRKFLGHKLMVLLGKSSYIFYLIHLGITYQLVYKYIPHLSLMFLLCNVVAVVLFLHVEEPLNMYLRKKFVSKH